MTAAFAVTLPGSRQVLIEGEAADLEGRLEWPEQPSGIAILLGDASGEGRELALVARRLRDAGLATLSVSLSERIARKPGLAEQLLGLVHWARRQPETARLPVGVCAPQAALGMTISAATLEPESIAAIVIHGVIPRGTHTELPGLHAATLFLVESDDPRDVLRTSAALAGLRCATLVVDLRRARSSPAAVASEELTADWTAEWLIEHLVFEPGRRAGNMAANEVAAV